MNNPIPTDERTIAQVITLLRGMVKYKKMDPPLSVALVVGSSAEATAWRKEAMDYLTAKHMGVKYAPSMVSLGGEGDDS